ncbi:MAG: YcjX family protein, partial [Actinobacteria bacterium]|nr:YcjX family protein [Actinomycetota bacterium]
MAISNRERVSRALDITAEALGSFVARQLAPHVPAGAEWPAILRALDEQKGNDKVGFLYAPTDLALQLRVMTERLGAIGFPFSSALSRAEQNLAGELRERLLAIDPTAPCDPALLEQLTEEWTAFLLRCRSEAGLSRNQPGRFMLPGSGIAPQMLMFVPLLGANQYSQGAAGSWWEQCRERFDYYRDFVVKGFYEQHFSRLDRQILLVDMLTPMQAGQAALRDLQLALEGVLGSFRYGQN